MKKPKILIFTLLGLLSISAQRPPATPAVIHLEDLPRLPMDTIKLDENTRVITFTNNTWEYFFPNKRELLAKDAYTANWVENQVFAYKNETFNMTAPVELKLVNSLSEYYAPYVGRVFSKFAPRRNRFHNGVDLPLKKGDPIYAAFAGRVRHAKFNTGGFGNLVILRHESGLETFYAHMSKINVEVNDYVRPGQVIGYCGSTGRSRGPHLHFEIRYHDMPFDPERIIDFESGDLKYMTFVLEPLMLNKYAKESETMDDESDIDAALENADTLSSDQILTNISQAQTAGERQRAAAQAAASAQQFHTIRSGDTLGAIARRYGTTVSKICALNSNLTSTTTLSLGRRIRVR